MPRVGRSLKFTGPAILTIHLPAGVRLPAKRLGGPLQAFSFLIKIGPTADDIVEEYLGLIYSGPIFQSPLDPTIGSVF